MAIKLGPLPVMDAGGSQVSQPPETEEDDQEQAIQTCPVCDDRSFQVPAAAFEILECGFNARTQGRAAHPLPPGRAVGEDDPGILLVALPGRAELHADRIRLPQLNWAEPRAPAPRDQFSAGQPTRCPASARRRAGVVGGQAADMEDLGPGPLLAQLHERMPDQATIREQRAVRVSQLWDAPIEQRGDHVPVVVLPGLVDGQDVPAHRHEPGMDQQAQLQYRGTLIPAGGIQHAGQAVISPETQQLAHELGPRRHDHHR
jgi:hypothetical protein